MRPLPQSCTNLREATVLSLEQEAKNTSCNFGIQKKKKLDFEKDLGYWTVIILCKKEKNEMVLLEFSIKVFYKELKVFS